MAFNFIIVSVEPLLKNKIDNYGSNQHYERYFRREENIQ